ncbi:prion-like protein doppel [Zootoca vivipara]|uniref:prion-like protein doppel n=1 Tax=Zootoca vivipara TaxID=8524 RepID=UPI00293B9A8C|nr:prion-like protein doppel [Zootoca vivipara]
MQRKLAAAVLFAALCGEICLSRKVGISPSKRFKKPYTKRPSRTTSPLQKYLCHGGQMIDGVELQPNDTDYYRDNWKDFPDGLYYPNCSLYREPNVSKEALVGECVTFVTPSTKLNLSLGKDANDPKQRVMWFVINHLCANESCSQPCPQRSNAGALHFFSQALIIGLLGCSVLSAK